MNAGNFRSLCAAVLLLGFIFVGLGGWGTYYFGLKSVKEKDDGRTALKEQPASPEPTNEKSPVPAEPPATPPIQLVKATTPPLITTAETKTPAPSPTPAKSQATRSLSDKQHQEIVDALRKHAGKSITICSAESDPEGLAFAGTLKHVFEEAGWHVDGVKQVPSAKSPAGLNLATGSFPSPESMAAAYSAFTSAGLTISQQLDAKLTGGQSELIVGPAQ